MNKKISLVVGLFLLSAASGWAYDRHLASTYEDLFSQVKGQNVGKALNVMTPQVFVNRLKLQAKMVPIDIRTPSESGIFGLLTPGSLQIPLDQLFKPRNLDRIPTDIPVVLICSSGARSAGAAIALRHLGFSNVHVLKGGFKELSSYLEDPKVANQAPDQ